VLPTYNESPNLEKVVAGVRHFGHDVLIVDDASPDGTGEMADRLAAADPGVRVLHRPRDGQRESGGRDETERAEGVARAVRAGGARDGVRGRGQPRLPAACGFSAAYTANTVGVGTPRRSPRRTA